MRKQVTKLINSLFLPRVDENYVTCMLEPVAQLHGVSIGESSLSFRHYDPMGEHRFPIQGSESTENHIKYSDIALILEMNAFLEIRLWNGFIYALSKQNSKKMTYNSNRNLRGMNYFEMKRPVKPGDIGKINL